MSHVSDAIDRTVCNANTRIHAHTRIRKKILQYYNNATTTLACVLIASTMPHARQYTYILCTYEHMTVFIAIIFVHNTPPPKPTSSPFFLTFYESIVHYA